MANSVKFAQGMNIIPVLKPHDLVNATHRTEFVDLDLAHWATFLVNFGDVTTGAGATCDTVTITVEASSIASSASAVKIPFSYRISNALATAGWGSITAGTSDGIALSCSDLGSVAVCIDVDPATFPALGSTYRWVGVCIVPASSTALNAGAQAFIETRYPGNTIPSST
jgi:hypothetical protein